MDFCCQISLVHEERKTYTEYYRQNNHDTIRGWIIAERYTQDQLLEGAVQGKQRDKQD